MNLSFLRPKIGLALSGGGPKGIAHIGVIKVLEKHGIKIDYISGTSAGSIAGAFYAATKDIAKMEQYIMGKNWLQILAIFLDPSFKMGMLKGKQLTIFLEDFLKDKKFFKDLKIPFSSVAVDINNGQVITLNKNELIPAILASCGAPLLFTPVIYNKKTLVDGGVVHPVPVNAVAKMGADIVIASNLYKFSNVINQAKKPNIFNIARRSVDVMLYHLAEYDIKSADVVVNPDLSGMNWGDLLKHENRENAILEGEKAMEKAIPVLITKINTYGIKKLFSSLWNKIWH